MTSVDVGDAVDVVYTGTTGSTVHVDWLNPDQVPVAEDVAVPEQPAGSGKFPVDLTPTGAGTWTALFTETGNDSQVERYYVRAAAVTGPPPLAVLGDVLAQQGSLTAAQQTLANALLRAASKLVRASFPRVDQLIRDGRLDADVVALGVTNMVLRVLRNPAGLKAETTGPFSRTYDTTAAAGLIVIADSDVPYFTPGGGGKTSSRSAIGMAQLGAGLAVDGGRCGW